MTALSRCRASFSSPLRKRRRSASYAVRATTLAGRVVWCRETKSPIAASGTSPYRDGRQRIADTIRTRPWHLAADPQPAHLDRIVAHAPIYTIDRPSDSAATGGVLRRQSASIAATQYVSKCVMVSSVTPSQRQAARYGHVGEARPKKRALLDVLLIVGDLRQRRLLGRIGDRHHRPGLQLETGGGGLRGSDQGLQRACRAARPAEARATGTVRQMLRSHRSRGREPASAPLP